MPELLYFRPANETFLISKAQASRVRNVILLSKLYCSRSLALGFFDAFVPSQTPANFLSGFKNFHVHAYPYSNRICPSTRIRHVSGFTLVSSTPLGILATGMRHKTCEFCCAFHSKELGSFFFRHGMKKYLDQRPHDSGFIVQSKFLLRRADSKSCGFFYRIHRIRVDGSKS